VSRAIVKDRNEYLDQLKAGLVLLLNDDDVNMLPIIPNAQERHVSNNGVSTDSKTECCYPSRIRILEGYG